MHDIYIIKDSISDYVLCVRSDGKIVQNGLLFLKCLFVCIDCLHYYSVRMWIQNAKYTNIISNMFSSNVEKLQIYKMCLEMGFESY